MSLVVISLFPWEKEESEEEDPTGASLVPCGFGVIEPPVSLSPATG